MDFMGTPNPFSLLQNKNKSELMFSFNNIDSRLYSETIDETTIAKYIPLIKLSM